MIPNKVSSRTRHMMDLALQGNESNKTAQLGPGCSKQEDCSSFVVIDPNNSVEDDCSAIIIDPSNEVLTDVFNKITVESNQVIIFDVKTNTLTKRELTENDLGDIVDETNVIGLDSNVEEVDIFLISPMSTHSSTFIPAFFKILSIFALCFHFLCPLSLKLLYYLLSALLLTFLFFLLLFSFAAGFIDSLISVSHIF